MKVIQLCLNLHDPMDCIVHEIFQVRILEWVAFPFSRGSSWPRNRMEISCIAGRFFTNWAIQEALSNLGSVIKALLVFFGDIMCTWFFMITFICITLCIFKEVLPSSFQPVSADGGIADLLPTLVGHRMYYWAAWCPWPGFLVGKGWNVSLAVWQG